MIEFDKKDISNRPLISKEGILKYYTDYEIFRYYCGNFEVGKTFLSPLREENNPSFNIFLHKSGQLLYNDFILGSGDFVNFIREKFTLNYYDALSKICIDLKLTNYFSYNKEIECFLLEKKEPKKYKFDKSKIKKTYIQIKRREWKPYDLDYWGEFGITMKTLKRYNVYPISHIFINNLIIKADPHAYSFIENKDGYNSYTIYQPFSKDNKWLKDHDSSVWYGWDQLPDTGETLLITKSIKDIMCAVEVLNINATGLQNEKILPKKHVIHSLYPRFKNIYLLYDNDFDKDINWGQNFAQKFADKFHLENLWIPSYFKAKDISDLTKKYGPKKTQEVWKQMINNIIPF